MLPPLAGCTAKGAVVLQGIGRYKWVGGLGNTLEIEFLESAVVTTQSDLQNCSFGALNYQL